MRLRVGTSGFAYKEWKGPFYPEDLPDGEMLRYYSERLDAVEINVTFYRMPTAKLLEGWTAQVPTEFSFALKANRRITHQKKLADCADDTAYFTATAATLGPRLGPTLVQLPPWLRVDPPLLDAFLAGLPAGYRAALEFRHASWFDEEVYAVLRERGAALVVSDTGDGDPPVVPTAPFGYARLRRVEYGDEDLAAWGERLGATGWEELHVFFKHEDAGTGPKLAARFREIVEAAT